MNDVALAAHRPIALEPPSAAKPKPDVRLDAWSVASRILAGTLLVIANGVHNDTTDSGTRGRSRPVVASRHAHRRH